MARADLHVHSRFSDRASDWFLQRIGAAESYTEPESIYSLAKSRGMDFVAITDHNSLCGALELKAAHPDDVIVGVETTTYFPEDHCKVHLLLYGIDEAVFEQVQALRASVFELREFICANGIAHSVAHATYAVNDRLTAERLEQLMLLFSNFETINGSRTFRQNDLWRRTLQALTPQSLARLAEKHGIEPAGKRPWEKGFTGGSDDHAGLLIARTWTETPARTAEEFVQSLRTRQCSAGGRHNDYRTLAFSIYKIACEYSTEKRSDHTKTLLTALSAPLFTEGASQSIPNQVRERMTVAWLRTRPMGRAIAGLLEALREKRGASLDDRLDTAYDHIAAVADELVLILAESSRRHLASGDMTALMRDGAAALPALFLAAPFFTSISALERGRDVSQEAARRLGVEPNGGKRVLWFTDTLSDLNGVSVTLRAMAREAHRRGDALMLGACLAEGDDTEGVMNLPCILETPLPYYETQMLRIPSFLRALRLVQEFDPDEVVVSTPGPVGLFGLLVATTLGVHLRAVYHTDFGAQLSLIGGPDSPARLVQAYEQWFYGCAGTVLVPTQAYATTLRDRGISDARIDLFHRGLDTEHFSPRRVNRAEFRQRFGLAEGPLSLFVGRISRDKDIGVLLEAHDIVQRDRPDAQLLIVGDGPHFEETVEAARELTGVAFAGRLSQEELPWVYSACDLLVFPSVIDTFGMAVLEAQACGLPVLVSDKGGPQEIIVPDVTGVVIGERSPEAWAAQMHSLMALKDEAPLRYRAMRDSARANGAGRAWDRFLDELTGREPGDRRAADEPVRRLA